MCTSTYSYRSNSQFIFYQEPSPLQLLPTLARLFAGCILPIQSLQACHVQTATATYVLSTYWYKHSTYSVQAWGIAMALAMPSMPWANFPGRPPPVFPVHPKCQSYYTHLQHTICILGIVSTVLHWYIL